MYLGLRGLLDPNVPGAQIRSCWVYEGMLLGAINLLHICRLKLPAETVVTQILLRTDGIRVSNAPLDVSEDRIFYLE